PDVQRHFAARGYEVLPISAVTGAGLDALRARLATCLQQAPQDMGPNTGQDTGQHTGQIR
ncbi:MAG TPA: hypothetical protein VIG57_01560, partial [Candidatus Entotheonella sp.]